jgi:cell volume regulation protein A
MMPGFDITTFEGLLFASSILILLSILANKASGRLGVPSLLLFLGLGMVAGSEGPGGIAFDNYSLAYSIGSFSLAIILFDGGLRTDMKKIKPVWTSACLLSSLSVIMTAVLTGIFAHFVLRLNYAQSALLGSIVSSTDAAAVFSILRSQSIGLRGSVKPLLEFESGSNDPTAIFLTFASLQYALMPESFGALEFASIATKQLILGAALGWGGGRLLAWGINHIRLDDIPLYSVLVLAATLLIFSGTSLVGGSGFLAVYIMGFTIGNEKLLHRAGIERFHDALAWISQILLFLTLGLLVYPSHLIPVAGKGLALAAFLIFVARPISTFTSLPGRLLNVKEKIFISWVGLRGAAPIILAILTVTNKVEGAEELFNLVFFVVLVSILVQGSTIPWMARKLGLDEILTFGPDNGSHVPEGFHQREVVVSPTSLASGQQIVSLTLPSGLLLTSLERNGHCFVPKGDTVIQAGDRIWTLARVSHLKAIEDLFGAKKEL